MHTLRGIILTEPLLNCYVVVNSTKITATTAIIVAITIAIVLAIELAIDLLNAKVKTLITIIVITVTTIIIAAIAIAKYEIVYLVIAIKKESLIVSITNISTSNKTTYN